MLNVTELVTGMTFQGTRQEVDMWKTIMLQVNYTKELKFEEKSAIRVVVDTIEKQLENSPIVVMEDYAGNTRGEIKFILNGLGYCMTIRRDDAYDDKQEPTPCTEDEGSWDKV